MKHLFLPVAVLFFLIACNNSGSTGSSTDSSLGNTSSETAPAGSGSDTMGNGPAVPFADSVNRCYLYTSGKDTIRMKLTQSGEAVSGELDYHWAEKDRNTGHFNGVMQGDTLVADYSFQSEGTVSTRQEVMLRQTDGFIVGSGPAKEIDGKQVFTDRSKLKFGTLKLTLTNCSDQ